ncbi:MULTISPECIES: hypothetical protein [unclassified Crocosphaera]|uniref:hypothetical protein n=1 Tax=unclassified Crocosphaera TaxID=2623705 RepID=UPI00257BA8E8|nr:hypothetical protein [Crocosphaera sp.]NQZ64851.1 hypothetical protein [Crocosphaera sp.]
MTNIRSLFTLSSVAALCLITVPTEAVTRSSLYLPNDNFCAVYKGMIHNEHTFFLWVNEEDKLTIEADNYLEVAVSHQGNTIIPYQVESAENPMTSQWSYETEMQQKHTILVRGTAPKANIRFCLHDK